MTGIQLWLEGKKTYIIMVLAFIFNLGQVAGWWTADNQWWMFINSILGFFGIGALRAGLSSEAKKLVK